jgi:hypothetical protein
VSLALLRCGTGNRDVVGYVAVGIVHTFFTSPRIEACPQADSDSNQSRDGNGYPSPAYPPGKYPLDVRVWDKKIPMGI